LAKIWQEKRAFYGRINSQEQNLLKTRSENRPAGVLGWEKILGIARLSPAGFMPQFSYLIQIAGQPVMILVPVKVRFATRNPER
jgi:hypothetical protein